MVENGTVTTVAGTGAFSYLDNVPALSAEFQNVHNIAYDNTRDLLYIYANIRLRVMNFTGPMPTTTPGPTTIPPTLTVSPTTATPGPTNTPQTYTGSGQLTTQVTGDESKLPTPQKNTSLVLYSSTNVTAVLPVTFTNKTEIPQQSVVLATIVTFNVTYVQTAVVVAVIVSDDYGNQVGKVTVSVSAAGQYSVNLKDLISNLIQIYNQGFTIRAIRGSILKVSLGIETQNVAIDIDSGVTSTIIVATAQTTAPTTIAPTTTTTTNVPSTVAPTTTKQLSGASHLLGTWTLFMAVFVFLV
jgi:hypothetical protein